MARTLKRKRAPEGASRGDAAPEGAPSGDKAAPSGDAAPEGAPSGDKAAPSGDAAPEGAPSGDKAALKAAPSGDAAPGGGVAFADIPDDPKALSDDHAVFYDLASSLGSVWGRFKAIEGAPEISVDYLYIRVLVPGTLEAPHFRTGNFKVGLGAKGVSISTFDSEGREVFHCRDCSNKAMISALLFETKGNSSTLASPGISLREDDDEEADQGDGKGDEEEADKGDGKGDEEEADKGDDEDDDEEADEEAEQFVELISELHGEVSEQVLDGYECDLTGLGGVVGSRAYEMHFSPPFFSDVDVPTSIYLKDMEKERFNVVLHDCLDSRMVANEIYAMCRA